MYVRKLNLNEKLRVQFTKMADLGVQTLAGMQSSPKWLTEVCAKLLGCKLTEMVDC